MANWAPVYDDWDDPDPGDCDEVYRLAAVPDFVWEGKDEYDPFAAENMPDDFPPEPTALDMLLMPFTNETGEDG